MLHFLRCPFNLLAHGQPGIRDWVTDPRHPVFKRSPASRNWFPSTGLHSYPLPTKKCAVKSSTRLQGLALECLGTWGVGHNAGSLSLMSGSICIRTFKAMSCIMGLTELGYSYPLPRPADQLIARIGQGAALRSRTQATGFGLCPHSPNPMLHSAVLNYLVHEEPNIREQVLNLRLPVCHAAGLHAPLLTVFTNGEPQIREPLQRDTYS